MLSPAHINSNFLKSDPFCFKEHACVLHDCLKVQDPLNLLGPYIQLVPISKYTDTYNV